MNVVKAFYFLITYLISFRKGRHENWRTVFFIIILYFFYFFGVQVNFYLNILCFMYFLYLTFFLPKEFSSHLPTYFTVLYYNYCEMKSACKDGTNEQSCNEYVKGSLIFHNSSFCWRIKSRTLRTPGWPDQSLSLAFPIDFAPNALSWKVW